MSNQVEIVREGLVLRFTLNNPENGNEITGEMFEAMLAELRKETENPQTRILHIRATGDKFCTGRERSARSTEEMKTEVKRLVGFKQLLRKLPLITIAEVQGDAKGFGFGMAILCDFAIVSEDAVLSFPEIKMGLAPTAVMSYLSEYIPIRQAFSLVVTGEPISPKRASEMGLVSESVPRHRLSKRVEEIIHSILQLDEQAVTDCKEFFQTAIQNHFDVNAKLAIHSLTVGSLSMNERKNNKRGCV
ncbi:enoyl-CoA hydratase/isomerase family protein [Effusibacillus lacus]|uniref:Enoyl-CoA hydratase n=1 Tax=Effusibacillus lacus TaxID=1348429 RepID=A0A292YDS3_9BACL|nr:enoyl-CoA hydratase/isomerase family protein [Effusibacillus lacus]TCS76465.1 enoyl-CoA hydratase/carnithine racemase [Effusibacillus lacus]GAX90512.1 enoyl-CoA hydratase [Effusibacillus lacus]